MISHLNKAQDLELDMIDKKGTLTPAAVVARARSGESALHKLFVWDDSKAADLHRLETARSIIRLRTVVVEHVHDVKKIVMRSPTKHDTETTRKYVCLNETKKDGNTQYHRLDSVLSDAKKRELLLMQAYQELLSFRKKYLVLSELAQVFAAIDAIKKTA